MIICLESSILGGFLCNQVPGLVTGQLHLAGLSKAVRVELIGNFMRDIAGCRVDFHNPLPNSDPRSVSSIALQQSGFTGVMTASNRVSRLPRRHRVSEDPIAEAEGLKNLLFLEWFNEQSQRVLIQSWCLHLKVTAPNWQLSPEQEAQQQRQARARRKHFLLTSRHNSPSPGISGLEMSGVADPFKPASPGVNPFVDFIELKDAVEKSGTIGNSVADPTRRICALNTELRRFGRLLTRAEQMHNRPAIIQLLSTVADLAQHLVLILQQFSPKEKVAWRNLVIDLEQSLPLFAAALNATDRLVQQSTPSSDETWLSPVQASLINIELRVRELLVRLR